MTHHFVKLSAFISSPVFLNDKRTGPFLQEFSPLLGANHTDMKLQLAQKKNSFVVFCFVPVLVAPQHFLDQKSFYIQLLHSL